MYSIVERCDLHGVHHDPRSGRRLGRLEANVRPGLSGTRETASRYRLFRSVEDPNEVFIQVEFASAEEAKTGGDLDRVDGR